MRHVVPQYGEQAVAFVARAENPLRNVPAAARLGSGIPKRPPLHAKEHRESDHRKRPHRLICERTRKIGKERRRVAGCRSRRDGHRMEFRKQRVHPSNGVHRIPGNADDDGHFQHKLEKVRPQNAPQTAKRHVQARERNQNQNADQLRGGFAQSQADGHDSGHRFGDPPENQAVHQQAEIQRAKPTQKCRGLPGIAHFRELHVSEKTRTPPQSREKKDGHHAGGQKAPPKPIAGNAISVDESGDHQRRVRGKRRRNHRGSRKPPRNVAPRNKIIFRALPRAASEIQAENQCDEQIARDGSPIGSGKCHRGSFPLCTGGSSDPFLVPLYWRVFKPILSPLYWRLFRPVLVPSIMDGLLPVLGSVLSLRACLPRTAQRAKLYSTFLPRHA